MCDTALRAISVVRRPILRSVFFFFFGKALIDRDLHRSRKQQRYLYQDLAVPCAGLFWRSWESRNASQLVVFTPGRFASFATSGHP